jgi:hypothetical protein
VENVESRAFRPTSTADGSLAACRAAGRTLLVLGGADMPPCSWDAAGGAGREP